MDRIVDRYCVTKDSLQPVVRWISDEYTPITAAVRMAHIAAVPWCLAALSVALGHEGFPLPNYVLQWVRLLFVWMLFRGIVNGRSWSWAPSITLYLVHCLVLSLLVAMNSWNRPIAC